MKESVHKSIYKISYTSARLPKVVNHFFHILKFLNFKVFLRNALRCFTCTLLGDNWGRQKLVRR